MKRYLWLALPILLLSKLAFCASIPVSLIASTLVSERMTEAGGDELYFTITEFRKPKNSTYTIPELPLYWRSDNLAQLKDVALWNGSIAENEAIQLQVSLVERDSPPWDVDDLLGTFKVTLRNERGVIMQLWERKEDSAVINGVKSDFIYKVDFNGGGGLYHGTYKLENGLKPLPGADHPAVGIGKEKAVETKVEEPVKPEVGTKDKVKK